MIEHKDYLIKKQNTLNFLDSKDGKYTKSAYDEPTYLTFRINFFPVFNQTNTYNDIPEPLFYNEETTKMGIYSTYDYLKNNVKETYRAILLEQFISLLKELNEIFPHYIKSIDGLNELLDVSPKRGSRIKKDALLTIKCYEGLDQRISTLKRLYKKVAWDDEYQRWILPDIMRYFRMDIYISEFRIFHESNLKDSKKSNFKLKGKMQNVSKLSTINTIKNIINDVDNLLGFDKTVAQNPFQLSHSIINEIIPTTKIECRMCEFDISNMFGELSSLSASNPKEKVLDDLEIKIKVGNIKETLLNNLIEGDKNNKNVFIDDLYLSYKDKNDNIFDINDEKSLININKKNNQRDIFYNRTGIDNSNINTTTNMFNQSSASKTLSYLGKAFKDTVKGALNWGDNWTNEQLNKLMFKKLGDSGLSTNDIIRAVTSANVNTMYNTFKTKAETVKNQYPELSSATNQDIALETFKSFLKESAKGEDKITSEISKVLLDYSETNASINIDEYMDILKDVNDEIQKDVEKNIIYSLEKDYTNNATDNNTIDTKIIL